MHRYENVHIQLVDLPPIDMHHSNGWIRSLVRQADVLLVVLDLASDPVESLELVLEELTNIGLEPVVRLPVGTDGEAVQSAEPKRLRVVGTHLDLPGAEEASAALQAQYGRRFSTLAVSATDGDGLDALGRWLFAALDMVRVYTQAKEPETRLRPAGRAPSGSHARNAGRGPAHRVDGYGEVRAGLGQRQVRRPARQPDLRARRRRHHRATHVAPACSRTKASFLRGPLEGVRVDLIVLRRRPLGCGCPYSCGNAAPAPAQW